MAFDQEEAYQLKQERHFYTALVYFKFGSTSEADIGGKAGSQGVGERCSHINLRGRVLIKQF